ncbi:ornithine decarboxylase [Photobacterium sp. Hal280]|uniref:ornithine decarboxylase n=1 Tax=Photobacterium sp. Hal280 TaxID=3035163 RepID=UPI00301D149F
MNEQFKIALCREAEVLIVSERTSITLSDIKEHLDVAAIVCSKNEKLTESAFKNRNNIPIFYLADDDEKMCNELIPFTGVFSVNGSDKREFNRQLEIAAQAYEASVLPPFLSTLTEYVSRGNTTFACPGHQGTSFYKKHPAGQKFVEFFGENIFRADVPHADPMLGYMLSHEGVPGDAEQSAAKVFNADKTYFVLNGTSASNKVVTNALLTPGDLVLFDRNNHKSCYHGALMQANATPVYLETTRNAYGFVGGIPAHCLTENYLREKVRACSPSKADQKRPFRLAIFQAGTCDGIVYNARDIIRKVGHLCDYILFDSAWLGYEQFITFMHQCSPLLQTLHENDPGIIVTQSVHKQMAGFSQASQIHKKDHHISAQARFCSDDLFNHAFMMHASTSPFYPIFASLDVNAKMHADGQGEVLWEECVRLGIEARKEIFSACHLIRPFVPPVIDGLDWQSHNTATIANDHRFFTFEPSQTWHSFQGIETGQYTLDPCKLLLTTPGINIESMEYEQTGIPATFLAYYLRDNGIVPEKCELNSIIFLLTPALTAQKVMHLVAKLVQFEKHIVEDRALSVVIPSVYQSNVARYSNYTINQLCHEMHSLYTQYDLQSLQRDMFVESNFPQVAVSPYEANIQFIRGNVVSVPLAEAEGRVAAEAALPYPPGIVCIAPGEVWGKAVLAYFLVIEELINLLPGFAPDFQGVSIRPDNQNKLRLYANVLR